MKKEFSSEFEELFYNSLDNLRKAKRLKKKAIKMCQDALDKNPK